MSEFVRLDPATEWFVPIVALLLWLAAGMFAAGLGKRNGLHWWNSTCREDDGSSRW